MAHRLSGPDLIAEQIARHHGDAASAAIAIYQLMVEDAHQAYHRGRTAGIMAGREMGLAEAADGARNGIEAIRGRVLYRSRSFANVRELMSLIGLPIGV